MQPAHPLRVAPGEVVVHRDEVHAPARERVEVRGQRRHERLALAGLHLRDPAEVERGAAHDLHVEVTLAEHPPAGLAHDRERLGEELVEHVGDERPSRGRGSWPRRARGRPRCLNSPVLAISCSSERRSISGSRALTSGTIAWTALRRRPSPAWRILLNNPMRRASLPAVRHPAPGRVRRPPGPPGQGASTSFSRTAYIAASTRERTCSFSRMLRTWLRTVFSAMTSSARDVLVRHPPRDQPQHLELTIGEAPAVVLLLEAT